MLANFDLQTANIKNKQIDIMLLILSIKYQFYNYIEQLKFLFYIY